MPKSVCRAGYPSGLSIQQFSYEASPALQAVIRRYLLPVENAQRNDNDLKTQPMLRVANETQRQPITTRD